MVASEATASRVARRWNFSLRHCVVAVVDRAVDREFSELETNSVLVELASQTGVRRYLGGKLNESSGIELATSSRPEQASIFARYSTAHFLFF